VNDVSNQTLTKPVILNLRYFFNDPYCISSLIGTYLTANKGIVFIIFLSFYLYLLNVPPQKKISGKKIKTKQFVNRVTFCIKPPKEKSKRYVVTHPKEWCNTPPFFLCFIKSFFLFFFFFVVAPLNYLIYAIVKEQPIYVDGGEDDPPTITLHPKQIRTFLITVEKGIYLPLNPIFTTKNYLL
jgi:hypothetical protein